MSVYKDKQRGTYYFVTRINGKQVKRRGFKSNKEAKRAEASFILDDSIDLENPSFEYVTNEYLKWYKKRRKESSYNKVEGITRINLLPVFGKKKINDIRNRDITNFHDDLIDNYSVAHGKIIHVILSAVFNFAIKQEYTKNNPARNVGNLEGKPKKHMDYWTLDEFKAFISHVDEFMYYVLFMVLYYSGIRKGEARALTWGDINFKGNSLNIDKTNYKGAVTTTKTGVARQIQMPRFVMRLLSQLKSESDPKMTYVVFGEFHKPVGLTTLGRRFNDYIKMSGVKKIRIHDLRHAHSSYLINKNVSISIISHRLGHKNASTTYDIYSHMYPSTEKEVVSNMEDDFKSAEIIELKQVKK